MRKMVNIRLLFVLFTLLILFHFSSLQKELLRFRANYNLEMKRKKIFYVYIEVFLYAICQKCV
jgi:hypothetical protein